MARVSSDRAIVICKSFLKNSPPGEFWDVVQGILTSQKSTLHYLFSLADVRGLAPPGLLNTVAYDAFKSFNEEQLTIAQLDDGRKVPFIFFFICFLFYSFLVFHYLPRYFTFYYYQILITKFGEVGESEYAFLYFSLKLI